MLLPLRPQPLLLLPDVWGADAFPQLVLESGDAVQTGEDRVQLGAGGLEIGGNS